MNAPLKVWGDPSTRTAYTIELYPIPGSDFALPTESVLVYAASFDEAFLIAKERAFVLNLEPRPRETTLN
ncbi:MAG TPA: hypothetical protein VF171_08615 [Trueperaceae bacterium]